MKIFRKGSLLGKICLPALLLAFIAFSFAGCATSSPTVPMPKSKTGQGAAIGAASGAALGAVIDRSNPLHGALVGAAGGALAGGAVGYYMDKQKNDLQTALSPEISSGQASVQKLPDNAVEVTMTPQSAFSQGSAVLNQNFVPTLQKVANVVKTYGKSTITVIGAPDAPAPGVGLAGDQASLAEQRAESVREMLISMGVKPVLITASGSPQATGSTEVIIQPLVASS